MNPGKIVRPTKMDDARLFRFPPGYAPRPLATALDWSAWNVRNDPATERTTAPGTGGDPAGGFAKAVEMCNNNGHCRKFDAGTMCPSYRVTRDERHLTRGRANALRLALSGQLGDDALTSQRMFDTMDLCVGCKGCRRDCPTGVDMAKMKVEFLYHYRKTHGLRLRDRLVAFLPRYAPVVSRLGWLANLRDAIPGMAAASERMLGLARERSLPRWRGDTFLRRTRSAPGAGQPASAAGGTRQASGPDAPQRQTQTQSKPEAREVVLWADTFDNYFEPENLHAARRVLEAAGYAVLLPRPAAGDAQPRRPLCCGRTFLASGLVDEAREEARRTLAALAPYVGRGIPIVGLEPSCLLTMRDEFLAMGLGEPARALASHALLFEQFLAREHAAGRLRLELRPLPQARALVHGHCHQKAFDAMRPVQTVLGLIPELRVELVESSCCGMAGSFGYEAAHREVSQAMAEASLLPAVRSAGEDAIVVADGTSCRHQIRDGAQREALHVARVLAAALAPAGH